MKTPQFIKNMLQWKPKVFAIAGTLILLILVAFANKTASEQHCSSINIEILNGEELQFITQEDIKSLVLKQDKDILRRKITSIDLKGIEEQLMNNNYIRNAEAHFDMEGNLLVHVLQKEPVIRVINPLRQQYYLDTEGKRFPVSGNFSAHVPLVTPADFTVTKKQDSTLRAIDSNIFVLAQYLRHDEFAGALTGQVILKNKREFSIIPRLGNFEIYLGELTGLDNKFLRLKSFYKTALPRAGWNTYDKIILKYDNQIIANR